MSNETAKQIQHEQYSMNTEYSRVVKDMNAGAMYPSWNNKADKQAPYPTAKLEGARVRKQVMGRGQ